MINKYRDFGNSTDSGRLWEYRFAYNHGSNILLGKCYAPSKEKAMQYIEEEKEEDVHVMRHNKYGSKNL